jgi:Xaa-Pro aminopeptidase
MSGNSGRLDQKVFARRRRDFMRLMDGGVMVMPTSPVRARNGDTEYPFRPDSDFYYLTGFPEPEAVVVLMPGREHGEYLLFCREKDPAMETWHGRRNGLEGAVEAYGADDAFPISDLGDILPGLLEDREKIYCNVGRYPEFDARILGWMNRIKERSRAGINAPYELVDLSHILHEQRLVKHQDEVRVMHRAAKVAAAGHTRAMKTCKPGMNEYQVKAELEYEFQRGGSQFPAYSSIVAGGANSCILHYTENNAELHDGDLLLIDAGAEIDCYASDLTRTFPVNGKFSDEQKTVYEIVLAAQQAAMDKSAPGFHWNEPHEAAVRVICQGLIDIGLLEGDVDSVIEDKSFQRYYMHRTGHWIGMDVHDVGDYKINHEWRELETGMVFTVEPGIYISAADDIDERWHNIGIRIEDDVLIQRKGHKVLTDGVPKKIADIESLMAE